ncbi:MAG: hypothetical protein J7K32_06580 [Deltaproteobacteria bacterium]|nr:hypothetical protein [Deltaproteobacteria bacterium]
MKNNYFIIIIILLILVADYSFPVGIIADDDYDVRAEFIQKKAVPGEIVTLCLKFKIPPGFKLPDNAEIAGLNGFDIVRKNNLPDGIDVDIFVDRVDDLDLPALEIYLYNKEGYNKNKKDGQKMLQSNPVVLSVQSAISVKPTENLLRPVRGIISGGYGIKKLLLIVFLAICIILAAIAVYYFIKYRRNKKSGQAAPVLPPHINAFNRIDSLVLSGIPDRYGRRSFCFILSEILREYVKGIRGFNALEMTLDEISKVVKEKDDIKLLGVLKKMDLVKFADTFISASSLEEQVGLSRAYINKTKPGEI